MKKFLFVLGVLLLGNLSSVFAFEAMEGDNVMVTENLGDDLYAAGSTVSILAEVEGDVFLAGNSVSIKNNITSDAFVAGNTLDIQGEIGDDLKAAGNVVNINAKIGDDAFVAGSTISFLQGTIVQGDAAIAGNLVTIQGEIEENLHVGGNVVMLDAVVAGDLYLEVQELQLGTNAKILGNARVTEKYQELLTPIVEGEIELIEGYQQDVITGHYVERGFKMNWYSVLWISLTAILMFFLLPNYMKKAGSLITSSPWRTLLHGFLLYIAPPLAIIILLITVIGTPIGLFAMFLYISLLAFTRLRVVVFGTAVLSKVLKLEKKDKTTRVLMQIALLVVTAIVAVLLPFIVNMILAFFAVGAGMKLDAEMIKKHA